MNKLPKDSICLVTGGSGTIGQAITKALIAGGAKRVYLTGRSLEKLHRSVDQIVKNSPNPNETRSILRCLPCDVTNEAAVERLFKAIDQEGNITLCVNNAGINAVGATVDLAGDDLRRVLDTNVVGPFLCARESMKRMKANGGGRIIMVGSLSAISPRPDSAPYTTSKFALLGLTQSLSLDCRPHNISVGIIHPGNVDSEMLTPEMKEGRQHEGFIPVHQVAQAVMYMAQLPYSTNVLEMTVSPTTQPFVGRG